MASWRMIETGAEEKKRILRNEKYQATSKRLEKGFMASK